MEANNMTMIPDTTANNPPTFLRLLVSKLFVKYPLDLLLFPAIQYQKHLRHFFLNGLPLPPSLLCGKLSDGRHIYELFYALLSHV